MASVLPPPPPPLQRLVAPMGVFDAVATFTVALRELDALGPPDHEDDFTMWPDGMPPEPQRVWHLRGHCGVQFLLAQNFYSEDVVVLADETAEVDHVLAHLPFSVSLEWRRGIPWRDEALRRAGHGGWRVIRIDDHGNRFELESLSRESSARCHASLLEARVHKQTYFAELQGTPPPLPPVEHGPSRFVLWRQDDLGNRIAVKRGPWRSSLEFLADRFNAQSRHKQHFFVEPS